MHGDAPVVHFGHMVLELLTVGTAYVREHKDLVLFLAVGGEGDGGPRIEFLKHPGPVLPFPFFGEIHQRIAVEAQKPAGEEMVAARRAVEEVTVTQLDFFDALHRAVRDALNA